MKEIPTLTTQRLTLGEIFAVDIPTIEKYAGNPNVAKHLLNLPHPYYEKDAIFWINMAHQGWADGSKCIFGIRLKDTQEFIGGVGLHVDARFNRAELGYWIGEPFWGKGYMSEAVGAVIQYGFEEVELNKVHAIHLLNNPASGKVMQKNGMVKEGEMKEHVKTQNGYQDIAQYGLTRKEYQTNDEN